MEHAIDPQFRSTGCDRSREQRCSGRDEDLVLYGRPIEVGMRTDEHGVPDRDRVPGSAANERILHDHDIVADPDFAIFGRQHRAMEDSCPFAQGDRATQHSRRCHVRGLRNDRPLSTVRKNHDQRAYSLRQQADTLREVR